MSIPGPPQELAWVTYILVGENWPRGDEDKMVELAAAWRQFGVAINPVEQELAQLLDEVSAAGDSPAIEAARDYLQQLVRGADAAFPKLRSALEAAATSAEQ